MVGAELQRAYVDLDVVFEEVLGQLTDLFGPSGAPHERLSVGLPDERANRKKRDGNLNIKASKTVRGKAISS